MNIKIISMLMISLSTIGLFAQKDLKIALNDWKNGNIKNAHEKVLQICEKNPDDYRAKHLIMKTFFVQGHYQQSLQVFNKIDKNYGRYKECAELAIQANFHLRDFEKALVIAENNKSTQLPYLQNFKSKPFTVIADCTYAVPFAGDSVIPSDYWPGVSGKINGSATLIRFDTGGDFLVIGLAAAQKLGIDLKHKFKTIHGATKVTSWQSIADSVSFDSGPAFLNIPVTIMPTLGDYVIFGTNILEPFLSTIDYPNKQFIFTPRGDKQLIDKHLTAFSGNIVKVPFYLWEDHYMFSKGKFADNENINLFFDSGLILLTEIDGKTVQASFTASKEALIKWGIDKSRLKKNGIIPTNFTLSVSGLDQPNTLIWYDNQLKKDRNFGGIRIDGLISHAWLKNYSWTIDFDRMEYVFGL